MKTLRALTLSALLFVGIGLQTKAQNADNPLASAPTQYSVFLFVTHEGGKPTIMHMYVDGKKVRIEQVEPETGMVTILRADQGIMYTGGGRLNEWQRPRLNPDEFKFLDISELANLSHEKIGTETTDGQACDKYRFSPSAGNSAFIWISQSTHLPVKEEALGVGVTTIWKHLNVGLKALLSLRRSSAPEDLPGAGGV